jgi:hypothetical protein
MTSPERAGPSVVLIPPPNRLTLRDRCPDTRSSAPKPVTCLYEATVRPDAVLAYLEHRGEGWTVVINPAGLSPIEHREALHPQ